MANEKTIETYFVEEVERIGGMCIKFPPLFYAGFPDRLVFLPGGLFVLVELKRPGKTARLLQRKVHAKLRRLGFRVEVIDTKIGVDTFILTL